MKKVLLKIQGINIISDYMTKELELAKVDFSSYSKVIHINTEKEFDVMLKALPSFMKEQINMRKSQKIMQYNNNQVRTKLKWIDYAVDILAFFGNAWIYKKVTSLVKKTVDKYTAEGYKVDILSHSLGTLIAMHSGARIHNFFCLASPIGFGVFPIRWTINSHFNMSKTKLKAIRTIGVYASQDIVSQDTEQAVDGILKQISPKVYSYGVDTGHQMLDIFTSLKKEGKYPLVSHWFDN